MMKIIILCDSKGAGINLRALKSHSITLKIYNTTITEQIRTKKD